MCILLYHSHVLETLLAHEAVGRLTCSGAAFLDAWDEVKSVIPISYAEQRESRCCARRGGQEAGGEEGVGKNAEGVQARGGSDGQEKVAAAEARKKAAENVAGRRTARARSPPPLPPPPPSSLPSRRRWR